MKSKPTKTELEKAYKVIGRARGNDLLEKRGKEFFAKIGAKGLKSRWSKIKK